MEDNIRSSTAIDQLAENVHKHRKIVQVLIALVTIAFAIVLLGLRVNPSPYFMAQDHESRIHELDIKELFSNSGEQILVVLEPSKGSPLDRTTVEAVQKLTDDLERLSLSAEIDSNLRNKLSLDDKSIQLLASIDKANDFERAALIRELEGALLEPSKADDSVASALSKLTYLYSPVTKVRSFSTIENLTATEDEIDLHPLLPEPGASKNSKNEWLLSPQQLQQFKKETLENPLFRGLLISEDVQQTTIQIELSIPKDDNRSTGILYQKVRELVDRFEYEGEIYLAGNPVIDAEMASSMQRDNMIFFPFVMLVISGILFVSFRSLSGIYVPLTIAGITTIWTLGFMVLVGIEQNIVTTVLPVFLLTVAVADAIHFYNHYLQSDDTFSKLERLQHTFSQLIRPLVLTSITTLIGFLALAWTDITFIREFGLLMALGVVVALLVTVLIAPILIPEKPPQSQTNHRLQSILSKVVALVLAHPLKFAGFVLFLSAISVASLPQLKFDQENINNFDADTVLRSHNDAILEHFDGTIPIDIWIDTGIQGGIYNPELVQGIERIQSYLEQREGIGFVLTPVDFLKRMYNLLTFEGHMLPKGFDEQLIAQEILIYENERSQDIKNVIDDQHRHARLIVLGESDAASFWGPILNDIESMAPAGTRLEINGYGKVMHSNIQEVITTNITSTIIALVLIGLVMVLLFKSVSLGVMGIVPLVLTVMMNYAVMSLLGIAVDVGTTIIASIAFGIGIDYSIHYLSAIERESKSSLGDAKVAIVRATEKVGVPIVVNSLTLAGGFLVLVASDFLVIQLLGAFISMTMLVSAINALVMIPLMHYLLNRPRSKETEMDGSLEVE